MNKSRHFLFPVLVVLALLGCSSDFSVAGGGLDVESSGGTLTGKVVPPDSGLASDVTIRLFPQNYDPASSEEIIPVTTSGADGVFKFEKVDSGKYNIEGLASDGKTMFFVSGIEALPDSFVSCSLSAPGQVIISTEGILDTGYFYISGSSHYVYISESGNFIQMNSVPSGILPSLYFVGGSSGEKVLISAFLEVRSDETLNVDAPSSWSYSAQISAESLVPGAGTTIPGHGFVSLVKLVDGSFDFSGVKLDGSDLRFYSSKGVPLAFEIEHWGMLDGKMQGHIWVKTDSLSSVTDYIVLYWGNSAASDASSGSAVFDTALGFSGVFHLCEEVAETKKSDVYRDVTYNANHGEDNIRSLGRAGVAGFGKQFEFDGKIKYDFISIKESRLYDFGLEPFTVSFWFTRDTLMQSCLVVFKDSTLEQNSELGISVDESNRLMVYRQVQEQTDTVLISPAIELATWHWVNVVRDQTGLFSLFINDQLISSSIYDVNLTNETCGKLVIIGTNLDLTAPSEAEAGYLSFVGNMDELRIEKIARSVEWIQSSYINISSPQTVTTLQ